MAPGLEKQLADLFQLIITVYGTSMAVGPLVQAYKIYISKSSRNVSRFHFSYVGFGTFLWLIWGVLSMNLPLIVANTVGTIAYALCVGAIFKWSASSTSGSNSSPVDLQ